jgi:chlorobactene glucosyltransferase
MSVLIPARDEERDIGPCVRSLLAQDYPEFEIVVLNDGSTDGTAAVLAGMENDRLRVFPGQSLPEGWNGKPWACHQLAELATGELLFFTDADTVHEPDTLAGVAAAMEAYEADFISAISRNEVRTLGEQVTVPFMIWSVVAILPLAVAYLFSRSGAFSAANGKFMVFRREAYDAVGGYAAVRDDAAEDLGICRLIKRAGLKWRLLDSSECVYTRMYDGFRSALRGFSKNFFAIFDYRIIPTVLVWLWVLAIAWQPILLSVLYFLRQSYTTHFWASLATVPVMALTWIVVSAKTRLPWHLFLLYPVSMTISAGIGLWSMVLTLSGRTSWKERSLVRHRVRPI